MTVAANTAFGRLRPGLSLAGAALAVAFLASPAYAGCGSTGVSTGVRPVSVNTGVHTGVNPAGGSSGSGGGSSCATGISHATKTASFASVGGGSVGGSPHGNWTHHNFAHQSFNFHGNSDSYKGPHRHNP